MDSIIVQSYADYEMLLIDDGSTDNSQQICEEYASTDSRIHVFHKPNGGVSSARNLGIEKATGDYVFFLDADDELKPECLSTLVKSLMEHKGADVVYGQIEYISKNGEDRQTKGQEEFTEEQERIAWLLLFHSGNGVWNKLIKRSIILEHNIRFEEGLIMGEDQFFLFLLQKHIQRLVVCTQPTYMYHLDNATSVTHAVDKTNSYCSELKVATICAQNLGSHPSKAECRFFYRFASIDRYILRSVECKDRKSIRKEIESLWKATKLTNSPFFIKYLAWYLQLPEVIASNRLLQKVYRMIIRVYMPKGTL